ncbi:MAG: hypothetical protein SFT91_02265, partial [Rickettsiaceae bacterium]|nr:hypothetical protein [Rickettsiaceae bacterium]
MPPEENPSVDISSLNASGTEPEVNSTINQILPEGDKKFYELHEDIKYLLNSGVKLDSILSAAATLVRRPGLLLRINYIKENPERILEVLKSPKTWQTLLENKAALQNFLQNNEKFLGSLFPVLKEQDPSRAPNFMDDDIMNSAILSLARNIAKYGEFDGGGPDLSHHDQSKEIEINKSKEDLYKNIAGLIDHLTKISAQPLSTKISLIANIVANDALSRIFTPRAREIGAGGVESEITDIKDAKESARALGFISERTLSYCTESSSYIDSKVEEACGFYESEQDMEIKSILDSKSPEYTPPEYKNPSVVEKLTNLGVSAIGGLLGGIASGLDLLITTKEEMDAAKAKQEHIEKAKSLRQFYQIHKIGKDREDNPASFNETKYNEQDIAFANFTSSMQGLAKTIDLKSDSTKKFVQNLSGDILYSALSDPVRKEKLVSFLDDLTKSMQPNQENKKEESDLIKSGVDLFLSCAKDQDLRKSVQNNVAILGDCVTKPYKEVATQISKILPDIMTGCAEHKKEISESIDPLLSSIKTIQSSPSLALCPWSIKRALDYGLSITSGALSNMTDEKLDEALQNKELQEAIFSAFAKPKSNDKREKVTQDNEMSINKQAFTKMMNDKKTRAELVSFLKGGSSSYTLANFCTVVSLGKKFYQHVENVKQSMEFKRERSVSQNIQTRQTALSIKKT